VIGRADVIDSAILEAAGAQVTDELQPKGYVQAAPGPTSLASDLPTFNIVHLPAHRPIVCEGEVLFRAQSTPTLVRRDRVTYWQPPDWSEPANQFLPRYQVGSLASHALATRALIDASARAGQSHASHAPFAQPATFHLWRSAGRVHILLGNLETGLTGDARTERRVQLSLNRRHLDLGAPDYELRDASGRIIRSESCSPSEVCFNIRLDPESSAVYVLTPVNASRTIGDKYEP
jgi:hypothetical protein